jgi:hypothetical protein
LDAIDAGVFDQQQAAGGGCEKKIGSKWHQLFVLFN